MPKAGSHAETNAGAGVAGRTVPVSVSRKWAWTADSLLETVLKTKLDALVRQAAACALPVLLSHVGGSVPVVHALPEIFSEQLSRVG
jgi:hypothetical protein